MTKYPMVKYPEAEVKEAHPDCLGTEPTIIG